MHNELGFVDWAAFKQMAPSIVRLEVGRLNRLLRTAAPGTERYHALVRARYALLQFIDGLDAAGKEEVEHTCALPLRAALLNLSLLAADPEEPEASALRAVLDRLRYVHDRIGLVY